MQSKEERAAKERVWQKKYRQSEKYRAARAARRTAHQLAQNEKYRLDPSKRLARSKAYYVANQERRKAYARQHYADNREKALVTQRLWRQNHLEQDRATKKLYSMANREKNDEAARRAMLRDPERIRANRRNHKARRKSVSGSHTAKDVLAIWKRQRHKCAVPNCTYAISSTGKHRYHVDHVLPIARGGSNNPDNLQILCATHNIRKNASDPYDWAQENGLLFM